MKHIFRGSVVALGAAAALFLYAAPCRADVLFVHDYKATEYLMGAQDAELLAGYTGQAMFLDKKARYTGRMMEVFLGKDKEVRETVHFLLDKDQIREIDYYKGKVIVFPLEKLSDISWIKGKETLDKDTAEMIRERYRTVPPKLSVTIHPKKETLGGYTCRRVDMNMRLETIDVKKNSSSVTLVKQTLWVSTTVPGYDEYTAFHRKLAKRLGLDALRLGNLSVLLGYWEGSLDPIRDSLKGVKGYPVKSVITVEGHYTASVGTDSAKTNTMQLKEESVELRKVLTGTLDKTRFMAPSEFGVTVVE
jgi:hypothetical protein